MVDSIDNIAARDRMRDNARKMAHNRDTERLRAEMAEDDGRIEYAARTAIMSFLDDWGDERLRYDLEFAGPLAKRVAEKVQRELQPKSDREKGPA